MSCWFWFFMISFIFGSSDATRNKWYKPLLRGAKLGNTTDSLAKETLSQARKASKQKFARSKLSNCSSCRSKSFANPCPDNWTIQEESCHAPQQYRGPCATVQTFTGDSVSEKREAEIACKVCWPCDEQDICDKNFDLPCPFGYAASAIPIFEYTLTKTHTCQSDFQSDCETTVSFPTLIDKQHFSERCDTQWPCKTSCSSISAACPQGSSLQQIHVHVDPW
jgi:CPW-WPC domain-containing protein